MRIGNIKHESTAEVKGHFADVIYMQGCYRDCKYCFNKELKSLDGGIEKSVESIVNSLSDLSSVVVITGGEPMLQKKELRGLVYMISGDKKIVLETAVPNMDLPKYFDKVLITFKTFDLCLNKYIEDINNHLDTYIPCVVIGHPWFDETSFARLCRHLDRIYCRFYNDKRRDIKTEYHIANRNNTKFIEFDKICL